MNAARATLPLALVLLSCSSDPAPPVDAGPHSTPGVCFPDPTGTGNNLNVGAYCSPGGGQCGNYSGENILLCSIDLDLEGDNFCIKLGCSDHATCGEQGCCTGRETSPVKACIPKGCLTDGDLTQPCPPIPGLGDAGVGDAGTSTTSDAQ